MDKRLIPKGKRFIFLKKNFDVPPLRRKNKTKIGLFFRLTKDDTRNARTFFVSALNECVDK